MRILRYLWLLLCLLAFSASAGATTFSYECAPCLNDPGAGLSVNERVGSFDRIVTTYDDVAQRFTWESTFSPFVDGSGAHFPNGGWLVVNAGGNPKAHVDELSILFIDGLNSRVTAYVYDGQNGVSGTLSDPSRYIATYDGGASFGANGDGTVSLALDLEVGVINGILAGPDWRGVRFDDELGIWFHPAENAHFQYAKDGRIDRFAYARQGWLDTSAQDTTNMPEPGAAVVFSLGLGLLASRQRSFKK